MHTSQMKTVSWLLTMLATSQFCLADEMPSSEETVNESLNLDHEIEDEGFEWQLSLEAERTSPLNLDENNSRDQREIVTAIDFDWRRALNSQLSINTAFALEHRVASADDTQAKRNDSGLVLDELFLNWRSPEAAVLQLGAGRFERQERSQWWWDDTLDGIAVDGHAQGFRYQIIFGEQARELDTFDEPRDVEEREISRTLLSLEFQPNSMTAIDVLFANAYDRSGHLDLDTVIDENRFDEIDSQLSWLGVNFDYRIVESARASIDIIGTGALLRGRDERQRASDGEDDETRDDEDEDDEASGDIDADNQTESPDAPDSVAEPITAGAIDRVRVDAWAIDLALRWQIMQGWNPSVTFQHAIGSGSRGADAFDSALFRQTGLEDNDDGASRYGLLYAPQLGNIAISAVSMALRPSPWMTLTARYLHFQRRSLASAVGETGIDADATARSKELGQELVFHIDMEVAETLTLSAAGGLFRAGRAYGAANDELSRGVWLTLDFEF